MKIHDKQLGLLTAIVWIVGMAFLVWLAFGCSQVRAQQFVDFSLDDPLVFEGAVLDTLCGCHWLQPDSLHLSIQKDVVGTYTLVFHKTYTTDSAEVSTFPDASSDYQDSAWVFSAKWMDLDSVFTMGQYGDRQYWPNSLWTFDQYKVTAEFWNEAQNANHREVRYLDLGARWAAEQQQIDYAHEDWGSEDPFTYFPGFVLDSFDTDIRWTLKWGEGSIILDSTIKKTGAASLQIAIDDNDSVCIEGAIQRDFISPDVFDSINIEGGNIAFDLYIDSTSFTGHAEEWGTTLLNRVPGIDSICLWFTKDADSSYTNAVYTTWPGTEFHIGWQTIIMTQDTAFLFEKGSHGCGFYFFGNPLPRYMKLEVFADDLAYADSVMINIDNFRIGEAGKPIVFMEFHDGSMAHAYFARTVMKHFHLRGCIAQISSRSEHYSLPTDSVYATWDEWRQNYSDGWDIGGHNDGCLWLSVLPSSGIKGVKSTLGFNYANLSRHAYNRSCGYYHWGHDGVNDTIIACAKPLYTLAVGGCESVRHGHYDLYSNPGATELYMLPYFSDPIGDQIDSLIDLILAQGNFAIWGWHSLNTETGRRNFWSACSTLDANRWSIDVMTFSEYREAQAKWHSFTTKMQTALDDLDLSGILTEEDLPIEANMTYYEGNTDVDGQIQSGVEDGLTNYGASTLDEDNNIGIDWGDIDNKSSSVTLTNTVVGTAADIGAVGKYGIADQTWNEARSGHTTDGTFGGQVDNDSTTLVAIKAKTDNLPADPADDSDIDGQLATIQTDLDNPDQYKATGFSTHSAADVWAETEADSILNAIHADNKANFKATGFSTHSATDVWSETGADSILNAIHADNKANFKATSVIVSGVDADAIEPGDMHGDWWTAFQDTTGKVLYDSGATGSFFVDSSSIIAGVEKAVHDSMLYLDTTTVTFGDDQVGRLIANAAAGGPDTWSSAQRDSVLNAIHADNKANFKATGFSTHSASDIWTASGGDSVLNAIHADNKPNFRATGFSTHSAADVWAETEADSILNAIHADNKANFKATGFSTHSAADVWSATGGDSVLNAIHADNKANFKATGFATSAQGDSLTNAIHADNKANFKATGFSTHSASDVWSETEADSILNAIHTDNKANFKATGFSTHSAADVWSETEADSILNAIHADNKVNFKATGFATSTQGDSITNAIHADNKANFRATGFATSTQGDSITNAIHADNKMNFKATGFSTHSAADVWSETEADSILNAIHADNKVNFKATGFSTHSASDVWSDAGGDSVLNAIHADNKPNFKATGFSTHSATDVWNVAFNTGFDAGSMGDSINNATYVQGEGGWTSDEKDSILNAIHADNKPNFKATGFSTHSASDVWSETEADSILNAIHADNKANFKATGFSTHSASDVWSATGGDSVLNAITDTNKDNFKGSGTGATAAEVWSYAGGYGRQLTRLDDDSTTIEITDLDSLTGAVADNNKANFKATGFSTHSASDVWSETEADSILNAIHADNKVNFRATGFSTHSAADVWSATGGDSVLNAITDVNKDNFKGSGTGATAAEVWSYIGGYGRQLTRLDDDSTTIEITDLDSLTGAIADDNKANFKATGFSTHSAADVWSETEADSILNAIHADNKANFKATGFATSTQGDSITNAIHADNKANFKATGFSTHNASDVWSVTGGDSVLNAIHADNKANFKATGFSTHSASDVWTGTGGDSVLNAIHADNKANFKAIGFSTHSAADVWTSTGGDSVLNAITDTNKDNFKGSGTGATAAEVWSYIGGYGRQLTRLDDDSTTIEITDLDSLTGAVVDGNKANFKATGFSTHSASDVWSETEADSILNAIHADNKPNFKATGFSTHSASDVWSATGGDSVLNAIHADNKVNFQGGTSTWSADQRDSILNAIHADNKANFKAAGFSTHSAADVWSETEADSILNAIHADNKANFKATGFSTHSAADVWNIAFGTAFDGGSMGDSLNNSTYVQGDASGLSAVDFWNVAFGTAFTSGSMGDSLNNATYVQGTDGGYGAYPCTILVRNTAGGVVGNMSVQAKILSSGQTYGRPATSTSGGLAHFTLDNNTYAMYCNDPDWTTTTPACTLSFATGISKTDTIFATAYDYAAGASGAIVNVYVVLLDNEGNGVSGATFSAKLNKDRVKYQDQWLLGYAVSDTTDSDGRAILGLISTDSLSDTNSKYRFSLKDSLGTVFENISVAVPGDSAGGSWRLDW